MLLNGKFSGQGRKLKAGPQNELFWALGRNEQVEITKSRPEQSG